MTVALVHAAATLAMMGLIWFVQIVHYPLFERVGEQGFADYERDHTTRTTWVVAPLMITELLTAIWLWMSPPQPGPWWLASVGLILLAVVWVSTALLQAPCHRSLSRCYDENVARRLAQTNWVRTIAWSGRAVVALALVSND